MTASIEDIRSTYGQLRRNEEEAQRGIARLREDLVHARERDVQAYADAALAGQEPPKRKEVTLRHKIDNLEVALEGYELAHRTLLEEAITAIGAGRRELSQHEQHLLRDFIIPRLTEEQKRELWQRGEVERAQEATPRPDDLIEFVTEAYDNVDARHEANEDARRKRDGYQHAIAAVQRAKSEHTRRGHDERDFRIQDYPDIVTSDLLQYLSSTPGRGSFQNRTQSDEVPWPGSLQDLQARSEPSATPA